MTLCHQIMDDIYTNMEKKRPDLKGSFSTHHYTLSQKNQLAGYADISYYDPYYFSESDFLFLDSLNWILFITGISSLILAVIAGKYSLQGTTQGNGLTGGVPPVRFSM